MTDALAAPNTVEVELIIGELERLHERCEKGIGLQSETTKDVRALDLRTRAALPEGSDAFHLYYSRMGGHTEYWERTLNGYVSKRDCQNIGRRIGVLREVLEEIEPTFLRAETGRPTQYYFQNGEVYRARQTLYRLLKRATDTIAIADPHLDPDVFDFIDALDPTLPVRLLTGAPKLLFVKQLHELQAASRRLEARSNDRNHDRFIILDRSEAWHLGASINGLGKKAFMMSKVIEESERTELSRSLRSGGARAGTSNASQEGQVVKLPRTMTQRQCEIAAESYAACLLAQAGYDVLVQYGANQPQYDLVAVKGNQFLPISVKGSQDGGWMLAVRHKEKGVNYHEAADRWLATQRKDVVFVFVQFINVALSAAPRAYVARPREIAAHLKTQAGGRGYGSLQEDYRRDHPRSQYSHKIPADWAFSADRIDAI